MTIPITSPAIMAHSTPIQIGDYVILVDSEDVEALTLIKWLPIVSPSGKVSFLVQTKIPDCDMVLTTYLHRWLLRGIADGYRVEFLNGCRFDFRKKNLWPTSLEN